MHRQEIPNFLDRWGGGGGGVDNRDIIKNFTFAPRAANKVIMGWDGPPYLHSKFLQVALPQVRTNWVLRIFLSNEVLHFPQKEHCPTI